MTFYTYTCISKYTEKYKKTEIISNMSQCSGSLQPAEDQLRKFRRASSGLLAATSLLKENDVKFGCLEECYIIILSLKSKVLFE